MKHFPRRSRKRKEQMHKIINSPKLEAYESFHLKVMAMFMVILTKYQSNLEHCLLDNHTLGDGTIHIPHSL